MHRYLLFLMALALVGCARPGGTVIDDGLRAALEDGPATVFISLDLPRLEPDAVVSLSRREAQVSQIQERVLSAVRPQDFKLLHRYRFAGGLAGVLTAEGLPRLLAAPQVAGVQLDVTGSGSLSESVPQISATQWAQAGVDGDGVIVAVLDSGIVDHPDLSDDILHESCVLEARFAAGGEPCPNGTGLQLNDPGAALDGDGHGTNVTGIITSRGTIAPAGVAPGAQIVAIKAFDDNNDFSASDLVAALDYLLTLIVSEDLAIRVVNISGGALVGTANCNVNLGAQTGDLVVMLEAFGALVVAASGNDSRRNELTYPACVNGVFSVGAVDDDNDLVSQTNVSSALDVLAPGRDITSTGITATGILTLTGTSQAAPHVVGCAALRLQDDPTLTPSDLKQILTLTSTFVNVAGTGLSFPRLFCGLPPTI